jgi:hypothetical protein
LYALLLVASAFANDESRLSGEERMWRTGALIGGVSALSLAGLLAGTAVSTWVFDVSTGELKLPIFEGEPR